MPEFKHTPEQARKLLVEALRSGEYQQGFGRLRWPAHQECDDEYCCLGVACDLFRVHESTAKWNGRIFMGRAERLPDRVRKWLGFAENTGTLREGCSLLSCNDDGMTFSEIADIIESGQVLLEAADAPN